MEIIKKFKKKLNEFLFQRRPQEYIVKRWDGVSDIELLSGIMGADPFTKEVNPVELDFDKIEKALILSPHQDDESLGVGGTIFLLRGAGIPVEVCFLSDGGVSNASYAANAEEATRVRMGEARQVAQYADFEIDIIDIPNDIPKPTVKHLEQLAKKIRDNKDSTIFIPWLLDSPPKHRYLHHLLLLANDHMGLPDVDLFQYQVHNTLVPTHFVDITHVIEKKRTCLSMYKSQNESLKPYDHLGVAMSAWNTRLLPSANKSLYAEFFFRISLDLNLKLVREHYFQDIYRTYRGHNALIRGIKELEENLRHYKK
ncbi:MAG: hypothetical protein Roseis2KO_05630 [Roseivirga sp.]